MSEIIKEEAASLIDAHGNSIEALHVRLASISGVDKEKLKKVVDTYKTAHQQFRDDALGCMN